MAAAVEVGTSKKGWIERGEIGKKCLNWTAQKNTFIVAPLSLSLNVRRRNFKSDQKKLKPGIGKWAKNKTTTRFQNFGWPGFNGLWVGTESRFEFE